MSIKFIEAGKREGATLIFPPFNLTISSDHITAIFTTMHIRTLLLNVCLGKATLSSGNIKIDEKPLNESRDDLGFLFLNEGHYQRLKVEEAILFFLRLYQSHLTVNQLLEKVQLEDVRQKSIESLSYSEKKRLQFAYLLTEHRRILIFEELNQNIDIETKQIFHIILQELHRAGKVIILLTESLENVVTLATAIYRLDEKGIKEITVDEDEKTVEQSSNSSDMVENKPVLLEKIPTKVEEKIVLFDPPEIDYIESIQGKTYLYINNESYYCMFTLTELEERLVPFGFFRSHRSYIVNLQQVREVISWTRNSYSLVLDNKQKTTIPLSKAKMAQLKERLRL